MTFHDAYGYFTDHYGLTPAIAVTLGDATAPSAARIREVQDQITAAGAVCAFPEATQPTRLIEDLTAGTNLRIGEALSPEGAELDIGAGLYGALLDQIGPVKRPRPYAAPGSWLVKKHSAKARSDGRAKALCETKRTG